LLTIRCLLYLLLIVGGGFSVTLAAQPRIIDGKLANSLVFPWVVSVRAGTIQCAGTLIAPQWVVTAGHCFTNASGRAIAPTLFAKTQVSPIAADGSIADKQAVNAQTVWIHPEYYPDYLLSNTADNADVALIYLATALEREPIGGIISSQLPADSQALVLGWGATRLSAGVYPMNYADSLLYAPQIIVSLDACRSVYPTQLTEHMLCANGTAQQPTADACAGDSGGPLVVAMEGGYWLAGVVSFGGTAESALCGDPAVPGVYTNLSHFLPFIQQHIPQLPVSAWSEPTQVASCSAEADVETLDTVLPCVRVGAAQMAVRLNYQAQTGLWSWNGQSRLAACSQPCASVDEAWILRIPSLLWQQQSFSATLNFIAPAQWQLHTIELLTP